MSMHIAILAFVASFVAITSWLANREPADHSASDAELVTQPSKTLPTETENTQQSEPVHDVIALSDNAQLVRSMLNELIIPVVDLDHTTLESAVDFLNLRTRELDPQQRSLSFIIRRPLRTSTDSLDSEYVLSHQQNDQQSITLYAENISLTKALDLICEKASYRWGISEHGLILSPLH